MIPKLDCRKCNKLPLYPEHPFVLDSTIGIVNRVPQEDSVSKISLHDQATLLLSISNIAQCEILKCPSVLSDDDSYQHRNILSSLPSFPKYLEDDDCGKESNYKSVLIPRTESLRLALRMGYDATPKLRSVSFDSPTSSFVDRSSISSSPSPLPPPPCLTPFLTDVEDSVMKRASKKGLKPSKRNAKSKMSSNRLPRKNSRSESGKCDYTTKVSPAVVSPRPSVSMVNGLESLIDPPILSSKSSLQSLPADGVTIKKIFRRKFSWKNYPELEEFLVFNREEYLRHSALNYTLQQKHYNNHLTAELLTLATKYGYMFDETDFNFVTVRDRIRCYYKSFVQSAKKRGILMGYAAKKAGLLTNQDLLGCNEGDEDVSDSIAMDLTH